MQIKHQISNSRSGRFTNPIFYEGKQYWSSHIHKSYEILHLFSGTLTVSIRGRRESVPKDGFAIIPPNEVHEVESSEDSSFFIGIYSEDHIHEFTKLENNRVGQSSVFTCDGDLLKLIRERLIFATDPSPYMTKACLYALCDAYTKCTEFSGRSEKQISVMSSIIDYVEQGFTENITLASAAECFGYDYAYFSKTFSSLFSTGFNDYVNIYRFNKATELLTETNMSITDISKASGFGSVRSFNNVFKKMAQLSPSEFRMALGSNKQKT